MYDYHPATQVPAISANAGQESSVTDDRPHSGDREGSASGSEGAGYGQYLEGSRDDPEAAEDPYMALTAQTLNADGTPKRPMNAFMIFARKRRPQISAANQMMRTGDISKILSKEWNSMDMADKKFYLDQAKKLKDNFNSKYPDYVYRRRPNNSRKKKKVEAEQQSPRESSVAGDNDESMEETSPIEMEGPGRDSGAPFQMRPPGGSSSVYQSDDSYMLSQTTSYPNVSDFGPGAQYSHAQRMAALSGQETSLSATTIAPLRIPTLADTNTSTHPYSYHPQSATTSPGTHGGQNPWDSSRSSRPDVRAGSSAWPTLPALDMSMTRQRSATLSTSSARSEAFSPHIPPRQWTGSTSSAASSSPGTPFPTLASPFYPAQSPSQRSVDLANSPSSHPTGSSEYFSTSPTFQRSVSSATRHAGGHEPGNYASSPVSQQPTSPYGSQWPYPRPPSSSQHRQLPSLQPISSYSMQPHANNGSPPSAHTAGVTYSWDRTRYDGHQ